MGWEIGQIEISRTMNEISAPLSMGGFALPPSLVCKLARGGRMLIGEL
jgi:hypothetical protein